MILLSLFRCALQGCNTTGAITLTVTGKVTLSKLNDFHPVGGSALPAVNPHRVFLFYPFTMNFIEVSPGVFVGMHMVTRFEIAMIQKGDPKHLLCLWVIGDGEKPSLEVVVATRDEAFTLLGMKPISNLNLVKP